MWLQSVECTEIFHKHQMSLKVTWSKLQSSHSRSIITSVPSKHDTWQKFNDQIPDYLFKNYFKSLELIKCEINYITQGFKLLVLALSLQFLNYKTTKAYALKIYIIHHSHL